MSLSAAEETYLGLMRYYALQVGIVTDNADPEGRKRVKVTIPGLVEETDWAWPIATLGGGSAGRGGVVSPDVGAKVGILFLGGDPERPYWMGGWWARPEDAPSELPADVEEVAAEAHLVQSFETKRLRITVDERDGKQQLFIVDKKSVEGEEPEVYFQIDLEKQAVRVRGTSALILESEGSIAIEANTVTIKGRVVRDDPAAI